MYNNNDYAEADYSKPLWCLLYLISDEREDNKDNNQGIFKFMQPRYWPEIHAYYETEEDCLRALRVFQRDTKPGEHCPYYERKMYLHHWNKPEI